MPRCMTHKSLLEFNLPRVTSDPNTIGVEVRFPCSPTIVKVPGFCYLYNVIVSEDKQVGQKSCLGTRTILDIYSYYSEISKNSSI